MPNLRVATPKRKFTTKHCENIDYRFRVDLEKFLFGELKEAFFPRVLDVFEQKVRSTFSAVCATRDATLADYHVHFDWYVRKKTFDGRVRYVRGAHAPSKNERPPFAEDFMDWFGRFFKAQTAAADVHALFSYPRARWRSALPLPMTLPIEGGEPVVEIDGMSMSFPKKLHGVSHLQLSVGDDAVWVDLCTDRRVSFREFDLGHELENLSEIATGLVREVS